MNMEQEIRKEVERIIDGMKCPKDFECCKSGLENLCRAKDIGLESFLECLEKNPQECEFSFSFGHSYFCHCPLRVYIAKKLKR